MHDLEHLSELVGELCSTLCSTLCSGHSTPRGPLMVAVSGGIDSTALSWLLVNAHRRGTFGSRIVLGHVDHGIRANSNFDAIAVRRLAERLGVPFELRHLHVPEDTGEDKLRDSRYHALDDMASAHGARVVATAHHADDVLETLWFRLGRGTGLRGLAGIPESRAFGRDKFVIRPLLQLPRATLERVCEHAGLETCEDETNHDLRKSRNHIRHRIIPRLRELTGDAGPRLLLAAAEIARDATAHIEFRAKEWLAERGEPAAVGQGWRVRIHASDDPATRSEAFRLVHLDLMDAAPSRDWLRRTQDLARGAPGRRLAGKGRTVAVTRTSAGLEFRPPSSVA